MHQFLTLSEKILAGQWAQPTGRLSATMLKKGLLLLGSCGNYDLGHNCKPQ